jgi:ATP/maltotriose-dependent transcriptional regulator MalT
MTEDDSKDKPGDKDVQGDKDAAKKGGQDDRDDDQGEVKFTPKQQEHINSLLAEERRKEAKKAEKLKKELDGLKTKKTEGDDKQAKDDPRITDLEGRLAKYEADKLADKICADLKIPKEEREKYIRHVTATDEDGIKEQLRALKQDFAPKKTGAGTNPAKAGKPGKNDSINAYIRSRGRVKAL